MCEGAIEEYGGTLRYVAVHLRTQEMCEKAVENGSCNLKFAPDWFVTQDQVKLWLDYDGYYWDDDDDDDDKDTLVEWCDGYKKRNAQKAQIKKELMPIAWHPSRWRDWCVPEDVKKETEKLWS